MKKFSKKEIEEGREWCLSKGYPRVEVRLGGRHISYFLLPQSLNEDLPGFVWRQTGEPSDGYVIGVCESVPVEFRPYAALEEYIEFMEMGLETPNRVVDSEKEVLGLVPPHLLLGYLTFRRDFFRRLLGCNRTNPETYLFSEEDVREFEKNLGMLEQVVSSYLPASQ